MNRLVFSFDKFFGRQQQFVDKYSVTCIQKTKDGPCKYSWFIFDNYFPITSYDYLGHYQIFNWRL